jgi:hypothetical protein
MFAQWVHAVSSSILAAYATCKLVFAHASFIPSQPGFIIGLEAQNLYPAKALKTLFKQGLTTLTQLTTLTSDITPFRVSPYSRYRPKLLVLRTAIQGTNRAPLKTIDVVNLPPLLCAALRRRFDVDDMLVVSDAMSHSQQTRYGKDFTEKHNRVTMESYDCSQLCNT